MNPQFPNLKAFPKLKIMSTPPNCPALKAHNTSAQGNALGNTSPQNPEPCKGEIKRCPFCGIRRATTPEPYMVNVEYAHYCGPCNTAHGIVHSSVDDVRQSIKTADIDTVYMALRMCSMRLHKTRRKLLQARLDKLTGLRNTALFAQFCPP